MEETVNEQQKVKAPANFKIKPMHIIGIVVLLVVIGVAYLVVSSSAGPVVAVGDTVQVNYTGTFTNGTVFDSSAGRAPLEFTVGANQVIPGFDNAVLGMKVNQEKTVTIPENDAYGPVNPDLILQVPSNSFGNQTLEVGMGVSRNLSNGEQIQGVVTAVNKTTVTLDFNPPLAGQTLIFKITVVGIQKKS